MLFTGKGGVGKTSVAAATAVRAAHRGRRVLVTSTDPAHSLADALGQPLGDHPCEVATAGTGTLHGQQIDAQQRLERHWREVRDYLVRVVTRGGLDAVQAEELVLLPGLDELFALIDLHRQATSGAYDLVVVDCAPTAETLRLLALPEGLRWYADRVLGPGRRLARALRPLGRGRGGDGEPRQDGRQAAGGPAVDGVVEDPGVRPGLRGVPVPDDRVFDVAERVHGDLRAVHELLQDPTTASIRLVMHAERLAVAETLRTATSLSLFGYAVDAVVVNRLLPDEVRDPLLATWKERQAGHLDDVRAAFAATTVLTAPLFPDELDGTAGLTALAEAVYGGGEGGLDESAVLSPGRPVEVHTTDDGHVLRIALPFVAGGEVDLHRRDGDLHLKVAGVARVVTLPARLRRQTVVGARFVDGGLEVRFAPHGTTTPAGAA